MKLEKIVTEGKSKKIYYLDEDTNFMTFKDHLRSITYKREENIKGTGLERLKACIYLMNLLESYGIKTELKEKSLVEIENKVGIVVKKVKAIPIEFIARYYAAGSILRLYPSIVSPNQKFENPLFKYDLKQDISVNGVDDPTLNESYIVGLHLLEEEEFVKCRDVLGKVADVLNKELARVGIRLIDFKMELGFDKDGNIVVIDEISQDCLRANDIITDKSVTKDAFRQMQTDEEVLNCYKRFNKMLIKRR